MVVKLSELCVAMPFFIAYTAELYEDELQCIFFLSTIELHKQTNNIFSIVLLCGDREQKLSVVLYICKNLIYTLQIIHFPIVK